MAKPEAVSPAETVPSSEKLKAWHKQVEAVRKNHLQAEIDGFNLIGTLIQKEIPQSITIRDFAINNQAVITAAARSLGIVGTDISSQWLDSHLPRGISQGQIQLSQPRSSYGITKSHYIEFRRGPEPNKWDRINITLKYFDGISADIDSGREQKVGGENISVNFNYRPGIIRDGERFYKLTSKSGTQLTGLLSTQGTLTKLVFVAELLSAAFPDQK